VLRILRRIISPEPPSPLSDTCPQDHHPHAYSSSLLHTGEKQKSPRGTPVRDEASGWKHRCLSGWKHRRFSGKGPRRKRRFSGKGPRRKCVYSGWKRRTLSLQHLHVFLAALAPTDGSAVVYLPRRLAAPPPAPAAPLPPPIASVVLACSSRYRPLQLRRSEVAAPAMGVCSSGGRPL
jgi:hypothetical protein